ncbi:SPW repeat protein [Mesorhizobium sp. M0051]|uniref:SPW repeat protein n=1 Tax=unclassified Mesorhizobium TaxID=325217 RepID=UPI00333E0207
MQKWLKSENRPVIDIVNLVAGIALAISPWYLGFAAEAYAAWNAWIAGAVIALIAVGALVAIHEYEEWANIVVGLCTLVSPWVLGFSAVAAALWAHVIVGVIVAVLAAGSLWSFGNRPLSKA